MNKNKLFAYLMKFINDERAMVFDLMRIVIMIISIFLGNLVGGYLSQWISMWGALIGSLLVGVVIYYVYSMLMGTPPNLMGAIVFGFLNYISTLITGLAGAQLGLSGGILAIVIQASILSILWGYLGGKAQPQQTVKSGIEPK